MSGAFLFAFDAAADDAGGRRGGRGGRRRGRGFGRRVAQFGHHHLVAARIRARHVRRAVLVRKGTRVFALEVLDLLDLLANREVVVAATGAGAGERRDEVAVGGAAGAVVEQPAAGRWCTAGGAGVGAAGADADVRVVVLGLRVVGTGRVVLLRGANAAGTAAAGTTAAAGAAVAFYRQRIQRQRTPER